MGSGLGGAVPRRLVRLCARGRFRVRQDPKPGDQQSPLPPLGWRGACSSYIHPPRRTPALHEALLWFAGERLAGSLLAEACNGLIPSFSIHFLLFIDN